MKTLLKLISFIGGCLIVIVIAVASNSAWMNACEQYIPSPYRYGDLYLLSNMPGYKIKIQTKIKSPIITQNENTTLTVIGDSYTVNLNSSFFNAGTYHFIHWDKIPDTIAPLDHTKKNIAIIESTERNIRWIFTKNNLLAIGKKSKQVIESHIDLSAENNLQYMLTNLDWELPFKEFKTYIHLKYFDKLSTMVTQAHGTGRLYLNETIDPKNSSSSFNPVENKEVASLVENLNKISKELSELGFNEVYISMIPNSASIYKKSHPQYNHLIERIQQYPEVKFKFINVYEPFKHEKNSVFECNDSHWNALGKQIWVFKINQLLKN